MDIVHQFTDEHLAYWSDFETKVANFTAPNEQAVGIEPALGIITQPRYPQDLGVACVRVAWKPNEIDVAALAQAGTIWLSTWGGLPPHQIEVQPPATRGPSYSCAIDDPSSGRLGPRETTSSALDLGSTDAYRNPGGSEVGE